MRTLRAGLVLVLLAAPLAYARPGEPPLGAPRRVTTPGEAACPVESEPEIAVTRAGTWVAYNDDSQCPLTPGFTRFTGLQLLPAGGGAAKFYDLRPHEPEGVYMGDPDLAAHPSGDGSVLLQTMYVSSRLAFVATELLHVTPDGRVTRLPSPTADLNGGGVDKPFLAADAGPRSRFRGRVYSVWDDSGLPWAVYLRAFDGRRWLPGVTVMVDNSGKPDVAVAPDGTVAIAVETHAGVSVALSRNGGRTIGRLYPALAGASPGSSGPACAGGATIGARQRVHRSPRVAYDAAGRLHVVAALGSTSQGLGLGGSGGSTVYHTTSSDGVTFSPQQAVARTGRSQWAAAIAPTPPGGIAVSWLETIDETDTSYDAWLAVRGRGSQFGSPTRLSPASSVLPPAMEAYGNALCYGIGDYTGLAPGPTGVVAVWPTTEGVARPGLDTDLLVREAVIR